MGGRGGRVLRVTNLDDSGPGSFRAACGAGGPRVVEFDVAGYIDLAKPVTVRNPYISILGQTAPGQGICLRRAPLRIQTHDVIVRYIRSRLGDTDLGVGYRDGDCLSIHLGRDEQDPDRWPHDVIIDHCSFSWATDEVIGVWNSRFYNEGQGAPLLERVTIQWCIISEPLLWKEGYSLALLVGEGIDRISIHHNLFAHSRTRNPRIKGGLAEVVNNVLYNTAHGILLGDEPGEATPPSWANVVGNVEVAGRDTGSCFTVLLDANTGCEAEATKKAHELFVQGNVGQHRAEGGDDWDVVGCGWARDAGPADRRFQALEPHEVGGVPVTVHDAGEALRLVLAGAGCSLPARDAVDERIVRDVLNGTGRIIGSPVEVGGYPPLDEEPVNPGRVRRVATWRSHREDAIVLGVEGSRVRVRREDLALYGSAGEVVAELERQAGMVGVRLPPIFVHVNRDGSLALAAWRAPGVWPEDEPEGLVGCG